MQAQGILEIVARSKFFRIAEFGERAAVEAAALTREALAHGEKCGPTTEADWGKVKFDRQIIAIARVVGANIIYTNDGQLARQAQADRMEALSLDQLPEPPVSPQLEMRLEPIEPESSSDDDEED
jgi:hypothetical protein